MDQVGLAVTQDGSSLLDNSWRSDIRFVKWQQTVGSKCSPMGGSISTFVVSYNAITDHSNAVIDQSKSIITGSCIIKSDNNPNK